jgi:hypothetical protein
MPMIPSVQDIIAGLLCGDYTAERANAWIQEHLTMAEERGKHRSPVTRDMQCLRDILLIGDEGEPLTLASDLKTGSNHFGDTCMRFEVRNPEGRSRYCVHVELAKLRIDD